MKLFEHANENQILGEATVLYLYLYEETIKNIKRHIPNWKDMKIIINLRDPSEAAFSLYSFFAQWGCESREFEEAFDNDQALIQNTESNFDRLELLHEHGRLLDYVGTYSYYRQVKSFMDSFPNVRIYLYDDLKSDTLAVMKDMFRFLGVDNSFTPDISGKHNVSMVPRADFLRHLFRALGKINNRFSDNYFINLLIPYKKRRQLGRRLITSRLTSKKLVIKNQTKQYLKKLYREDVLRLQDLIKRDLSSWLK